MSDLNQINAYATIPLSVAGFAVAYWQIYKARSAAESAKTAVASTENVVAKNRVLFIVPQLRRIGQSLSVAIDKKSSELALHHLVECRYQAAELRGILTLLGEDDKMLLSTIQNSAAQAKLAVQAIRKSQADLAKIAYAASKAIMDVTSIITESASELVGQGQVMSNIIEALARRLLAATEKGKVTRAATSNDDSFVWSGANATFVVSQAAFGDKTVLSR